MKFKITSVLLLINVILFSQTVTEIPLSYDTSGYAENNQTEGLGNSAITVVDPLAPTVNAEMNVSETGALTYMLPIETLKGINNFQPNIALAYNSQSGNGQAGWGWNIMGLSMISRGGKSKEIDGVTQGPQFNDNDPFYLDGQRLIKLSDTEFVAEKFSKVKITKQTSGEYQFIIRYTDGRIAKYKELVTGQYYIASMLDPFDNEIKYSYQTDNYVPRITKISYGGTNSPLSINFEYKSRQTSSIGFRNGVKFINSIILSSVYSSSTYDGIFRKYSLKHDFIRGNTVERLIEVNVENKVGDQLKPLKFNYNLSVTSATVQKKIKNNAGLVPNTQGLGDIVAGDFYGKGELSTCYISKDTEGKFSLVSSTYGKLPIAVDEFSSLMVSKTLNNNNQITERDQLIVMTGGFFREMSVYDLVTFNKKTVYSQFGGSVSWIFDFLTGQFVLNHSTSNYITADFNNDGLTDVFTLNSGDFAVSSSATLFEIGKNQGTQSIPFTIAGNFISPYNQMYPIEMDGDGIPEILTISNYGTTYTIYKINHQNNSIDVFNNLKDIPLNDFYNELALPKRSTPLIFGDFNGDGLTDFMTPKTVYYFDADNQASDVVKRMETETLIWWEYLNNGKGFNITAKDYTTQKLAYLMPSQRVYAKASGSFWQKLWSGPNYEYDYTEYGATTVIPTDFNNDGKTDIISFSKFGKVRYSESQKLNQAQYENMNVAYWNFTWPISLISSLYTNRITFHENKSDSQGNTTLNPIPEYLPLNVDLISPLAIPLQTSDFNQLNTYKSGLIISDPLTKKDISYTINNDQFTETLIKKIDNGSNVFQQVEYKPMMEDINSNSEICYTKNQSTASFAYPIYVHKNNGTTYLVNKIHTLFDSKILTKEYRYENAIQHLEGKGFLGFQKTFTSDAYESVFENNKYRIKDPFKAVFWNIQTKDPLMDNAVVSSTYGGLKKFITQTTSTNKKFDRGNHQYLILSTDEVTEDYLRKITIPKKYDYDENDDLKLKTSYTDYAGVGSTLINYTYKPEFTDGDHYYYGKIESVETTTSKDGLSFTSKEINTYTTKGTVNYNYKYGNDATAPPLITNSAYDNAGNIYNQTIYMNGVSPQSTSYEYDATKRYVKKTTTPDGLSSSVEVSPIGLVSEEKSSLGLKTYYTYDSWGNITEITDYLGKKTTISKSVSSGVPTGVYDLHKKREGGTESIVTFDQFDREIQSKTQSINGKWLVVKTEYDAFGKKIKYSEPFFDGEAPKWNEIKYDELNRPTENKLYTGIIIKTCYEGMKVTVDDGYKKTSKTLDAMGHTIRHQDHGGVIGYTYFPNGELKETDYEGIKTTFEIDGWGRKTKIIDPSAGTFTYQYDNLGRVTREDNPKGYTLYTYDSIGRPVTEKTYGKTSAENTSIEKTFTYNTNTKLPEKITGTSNGKNYIYTTQYDQYFRITGKTEQTPDFTYTSSTTFDSYGRADEVSISTVLPNSYTSSSKIKNIYDSNGILIQQNDVNNNHMIWHVTDVDAKGRTTTMEYGNGYQLSNTYNTSNYALEKISHNRNGINILDIGYTYDVNKGVLDKRHNFTFAKEEKFTYDTLNRLLTETVNNVLVNEYTYDQRGRITSNTELGKYNYSGSDYRLQSINFNTNGQNVNAQRGFASATYNAFKSPLSVTLAGKENLNFEYNILKSRYSMVSTVSGETKFYSSDFAVEMKKKGSTTEIVTYITGDPYSANYIQKEILNNGSLLSKNNYYLHRDNIGSIVAITKTDGSVAEKRFFDAWGNLKALVNEAGQTITDAQQLINYNFLIDRGYTGHEHLWKAGLINMNARLYDPILRKFLSADNLVQDPYNTQSYDRYSYVFNNPLLYVDLDGNEGITVAAVAIAAAIAAAVSVAVKIVMNAIQGVPIWYGLGKANLMGTVMGIISFGIGSAASTAFGVGFSWGSAAFQAGMHGITGGMMSVLENGSINSGFLSGAISSLVASGVQGLGSIKGTYNCSMADTNRGLLKASMIVAGGLSGGISSSIAGGNFWQGFRQGLITAGLNHVAHMGAAGIEYLKYKSKLKEALEDAGYVNPESTEAKFDERTIGELLTSVKMLREMYNSVKRPTIELTENTGEYAGVNGRTNPIATMKPGDFSSFESNKIEDIVIARSAFKSIFKLSAVLGHEFTHAQHIISGNFQYWVRHYKSIDAATNMSEIGAHSWSISVGDTSSIEKIKLYRWPN
ncbi:RHS repeat-associated core domain-containing protein [Epilithonimonas caeni]|uniref:RHS repeat-associated core domain-containing protein n=1 Tax=Epilithonimonas caeni TaxID=365343 RepID=UPI00048A076F|nr:RHS repeat-associated core domain-containing protein [Epilithonimonas caeni]